MNEKGLFDTACRKYVREYGDSAGTPLWEASDVSYVTEADSPTRPYAAMITLADHQGTLAYYAWLRRSDEMKQVDKDVSDFVTAHECVFRDRMEIE